MRDFLRVLVGADLGLRWWERFGLFVLCGSMGVALVIGLSWGGGRSC